jgi:hypothetical protein
LVAVHEYHDFDDLLDRARGAQVGQLVICLDLGVALVTVVDAASSRSSAPFIACSASTGEVLVPLGPGLD